MRRAWAALVAVWATLAIVAALAWSNHPAPALSAPAPKTFVVVKGPHGKHRVMVVKSSAAPITMTHSSQVAR